MPRNRKDPSTNVDLPAFLNPNQADGLPPSTPPEAPVSESTALQPTAPGAGADPSQTDIIADPTIGDLARSSGADPAADVYDDLPTHLLQTSDPDVDEMAPYAPGRPDINRALAEETGGFVPPPRTPVRDYVPDTHVSADRPAEPVSEVAPDAWQHLGDLAAQRLADLPDPKGRDMIVKFVARVEILQAWQFNANLHDAPAWIDRNWLAWDDGPALNVTRVDGTHAGTATRGDWIVRQNTTIDDKASPTGVRVLPDHIAVIREEEFSRLYRVEIAPTTPTDPKSSSPVPRISDAA